MNNIIKKQREVHAGAVLGPYRVTPWNDGFIIQKQRKSFGNSVVAEAKHLSDAKAICAAMNQREAMLDLVEAVGAVTEYVGKLDKDGGIKAETKLGLLQLFMVQREAHAAVISKMEEG